MSGIAMGGASNITLYNAMTIDVGSSANVTKLNIGLPSVMVHPVTTDATITLAATKDLSGSQPVWGTLYNDQFALIVNPTGVGSVTISSHTATQGIESAFNNVYLAIPAVAVDASWGDADGFGNTYTSAGYIGVRDFMTSDTMLIALSGTTSIDVGTSAGVTVLNIVLPTAVINPTGVNITAPLALGSIKDFSDNQQLLGSMNMSGFTATMTGSMQVMSH